MSTSDEPRPYSLWRHARGATYTMLAVATHSDTEGRLVVYLDQLGNGWARPLGMFLDRFTPLEGPAPGAAPGAGATERDRPAAAGSRTVPRREHSAPAHPALTGRHDVSSPRGGAGEPAGYRWHCRPRSERAPDTRTLAVRPQGRIGTKRRP